MKNKSQKYFSPTISILRSLVGNALYNLPELSEFCQVCLFRAHLPICLCCFTASSSECRAIRTPAPPSKGRGKTLFVEKTSGFQKSGFFENPVWVGVENLHAGELDEF